MINKRDGQSLVELLAAMAVLAIGILAVVKVTTRSINNATYAKSLGLATKYAQASIEEVRFLRETEPADVFFVDGYCSKTEAIDSLFTLERTCRLSGETINVTVVVSWGDGAGTHESTITTGFTNYR